MESEQETAAQAGDESRDRSRSGSRENAEDSLSQTISNHHKRKKKRHSSTSWHSKKSKKHKHHHGHHSTPGSSLDRPDGDELKEPALLGKALKEIQPTIVEKLETTACVQESVDVLGKNVYDATPTEEASREPNL